MFQWESVRRAADVLLLLFRIVVFRLEKSFVHKVGAVYTVTALCHFRIRRCDVCFLQHFWNEACLYCLAVFMHTKNKWMESVSQEEEEKVTDVVRRNVGSFSLQLCIASIKPPFYTSSEPEHRKRLQAEKMKKQTALFLNESWSPAFQTEIHPVLISQQVIHIMTIRFHQDQYHLVS